MAKVLCGKATYVSCIVQLALNEITAQHLLHFLSGHEKSCGLLTRDLVSSYQTGNTFFELFAVDDTGTNCFKWDPITLGSVD